MIRTHLSSVYGGYNSNDYFEVFELFFTVFTGYLTPDTGYPARYQVGDTIRPIPTRVCKCL